MTRIRQGSHPNVPGQSGITGLRTPKPQNNARPMVSGRNRNPTTPTSGNRDANDHGDGKKLKGKRGPWNRARALADSAINDAIRDLRPEARAARRLYRRSVGDINHIYDESGDYINYQNGLINQQTVNAQASSQQLAAQLAAQLSATGTAAQTGADSELARLGISGSAMPGYFAADQASAQNVGSLIGANNQQNIALMGQGASQVGSLLAGANAGARGSSLGQALTTRNEAIAKVHEAMQAARAGRKDMVLQLFEQLAQSGWGRYMSGGGGGSSSGGGYSSAGYGSSGSSSSSGGNTYYGTRVDEQIAALAGGTKSKGKKPKADPYGDGHRQPHITIPASQYNG